MDQMAAVLGEAGALMAMVCQPAEVEPAVVIPGHLRLWGLDSGGSGNETLLWEPWSVSQQRWSQQWSSQGTCGSGAWTRVGLGVARVWRLL